MSEDGMSNQFAFATIDYAPQHTLAQQENRRRHEEIVRPRTAGSTVHWGHDISVRDAHQISHNGAEALSKTSETPLVSSRERKPSILGLFSVKEPSSRALKEYEELLKKQQNRIGDKGRPSAVGMPMISAAKLPSNVPRVNSKWDGLPARRKPDRKNGQSLKGSTSDSRLPSPSGSQSLSSYKSGSSSISVSVALEPIQNQKRLLKGCRKGEMVTSQASLESDFENLHFSSSFPLTAQSSSQDVHEMSEEENETSRTLVDGKERKVSLTEEPWSKPTVSKGSGNFFKTLKSKGSLYFSKEGSK